MSNEPDRLASRLIDVCVGILLASMALYGAVQVVEAIWLPLCITLFTVTVIVGTVWFLIGRFRHW